MKRTLILFVAVSLGLASALAFAGNDIYPFVPFTKEQIYKSVKNLSEDETPIINVYDIAKNKLDEGEPLKRPWTGSYWPLNQGMVANVYQAKSYIRFWQFLSWEINVKNYKGRKEGYLAYSDNMSEDELSGLAPSEKYDLLMGDKSFDLTNRIWDYAEKWGNEKKWGFVSSVSLPDPTYKLPKGNTFMALWEGICHGWATAAGNVPRPTKTVIATLPDGRKLPFYPDDIKALVSVLWANSMVQENVKMEGNRCWNGNAPRDDYGRRYDVPNRDTPPGNDNLPNCADVHPASFHLVLVNLTGKQKRSFVVDIKPNEKVDNHPVASYAFSYFNPDSGGWGDLEDSIIDYASFRKDDPMKNARHPETKKLLGVQVSMEYADWSRPFGNEEDSEDYDKSKFLKYYYDLELDHYGNVIGGQWRTSKNYVSESRPGVGRPQPSGPDQYMPDFIWVTPKDSSQYFKSIPGLEPWSLTSGKPIPASWSVAARKAHSFIYQMTREFGWNLKCPVENAAGQVKEVPCEFKFPKPQPMAQVVNELIELAE